MFDGLLDVIEKAEIITIFRHSHADMDALGSQYGLKFWIEENYPEKQVFALGQDRDDQLFPLSDEISDEIIKESLAIVLDCSGISRVDDQRFLSAKTIVVIDHHPEQDHFMHYEYRFVSYAATCEILCEFFLQSKKQFSSRVATCLYRGLLTDTLSFKTNNTTAHTLKMASELCDRGIDIVKCNNDVFDISRNRFEFSSYLRSKAHIEENGLVYAILNAEECSQYGLTTNQAKEMVSQFQGVKEFEIWGIFVENSSKTYDASLRSRSKTINHVANQFGGGGHACACGIKSMTYTQMMDCLQALRDVINQ